MPIFSGNERVAGHHEPLGRGLRQVDPGHRQGIVSRAAAVPDSVEMPELLRPLSAYEAVAGGAW
ncbi:MAG: hypothetical protein MUC77_01185 [Chromatiaceae bacterium]|nr:hypothetical protein [Chromatiaceae bacterium]